MQGTLLNGCPFLLDYLRNAEPIYHVDSYELRHRLISEISHRDCLGPFREVVSCYYDISITCYHGYLKGTYDIYTQAANGQECVVGYKGSGG